MEGYEHIDTVLESGTKSLSLNEFEAIANENEAIILDVRHQNEFAKGFERTYGWAWLLKLYSELKSWDDD